MDWHDFVDVEIIALVAKHVSGTLAIIAGFLLIGFAAKLAIHDAFVIEVVNYAEIVIITACVLRAVIVMLWKITKMTGKTLKGGGNGTTSSILAI
jgi:hypothetical protein